MKRVFTISLPPVLVAIVLATSALTVSACGGTLGSAGSDAAATAQTATAAHTGSLDQSTTTTPTSVGSGSKTAAGTQSGAVTDTVDDSPGEYTATGTRYVSATKSISISTVSIGSGQNTITYYVADVQLSEGTDLRSAFSNGGFGAKAQDTSTIAAANDAIVAINGDYYSSRDDGIIIRNGVIYRDVPARTGLALYKDGTMEVYAESEVSAEQLLADGVWNTFSFGPALLVDGEIADGLDTYEADPNARHPIQGTNPRTGIGVVEANHFVFVVVDGRSPGYSRGVTLEEFAQIFEDLGCTTAYNLDGGGSSTLYFRGSVVNDPSQKNGERSVSDILFIG
jgi:exopolysaccharide biosynthesis protein